MPSIALDPTRHHPPTPMLPPTFDRKRAEVAQILDRAPIANPDERRMKMEVLAATHAYQGGGNVVYVALWQLTALVRFHDSPGSLLHDADAWAPTHRVLNALRDAAAGNWAPLRAMMPEPETLDLSTRDRLRAFAAAGVWGLWGATGVTQKKASELVSEEFKTAGISVEPDSAREFFKRVRKGHPGVHDLYKNLTADLPAARSLPERKAWLKRLAETAGQAVRTRLWPGESESQGPDRQAGGPPGKKARL